MAETLLQATVLSKRFGALQRATRPVGSAIDTIKPCKPQDEPDCTH